LVTMIVRPSGSHAGEVVQVLGAIVPELGQFFVGPPALHLDYDRSHFEVVGQAAVASEGDSGENRKLPKLKLLAQDTQHGAALAMPLIEQCVKIAAVLDVLLGFIEDDCRLKHLDRAEQGRRRDASCPLGATHHLVEEAQHRCLATALGR